jgi:hypothetical protein
MNNNSHRDCRHEATKAARTECRKLRAQGIDTTAGIDAIAAHRLHRAYPDHNLYCCWSIAMSFLENYTTSQIEDPTADWCKGEPTPELIFAQASDAMSGMCRCEDSYDRFYC